MINKLKISKPSEAGVPANSLSSREDSLTLMRGAAAPLSSQPAQRLTRQYLRERTLPALLGEIERDVTKISPD